MSTPNVTGTSGVRAGGHDPVETADAMLEVHRLALDDAAEAYDGMIASTARQAPSKRNLEGARHANDGDVRALAPASASADCAPRSNPSVMSLLNVDTTTAKRRPVALCEPCNLHVDEDTGQFPRVRTEITPGV